MAWTSLSYAFGSLLTSTKMTQLYDNITALANGDTGAPAIQPAAFRPYVAGSYQIGAGFWTKVVSSTSAVLAAEFMTGLAGNFTVGWNHEPGGATVTSALRINSLGVSSAYTSAANSRCFLTRNVTSASAGDLIQIFGTCGVGGYLAISEFGIMVDGPYLLNAKRPIVVTP